MLWILRQVLYFLCSGKVRGPTLKYKICLLSNFYVYHVCCFHIKVYLPSWERRKTASVFLHLMEFFKRIIIFWKIKVSQLLGIIIPSNSNKNHVCEGWPCRNGWEWKMLVANEYIYSKLSFSVVDAQLPSMGVMVHFCGTQKLSALLVSEWIAHLVDSKFCLPLFKGTVWYKCVG